MDAINRLLVGYLLNSFWQVTVIAGLALLCSFYLRRLPGRYRHGLWVLCLGACVLVPATTVVMQVRSDARSGMGATVTGLEHPQRAPLRQGGWSFLSLRSRNRPVLFAPVWVNGLAFSYLALLIFRSAQLGWTYRRTSQIRKLAYERMVPRALEKAAERCRELFGITSIPLLCSEEVESPSTVGWQNPVLLVPNNFFSDQIREEDLVSALSHEMAHIRRQDFLLNLVYEVLSLPLWIHPATALMKSRIAETKRVGLRRDGRRASALGKTICALAAADRTERSCRRPSGKVELRDGAVRYESLRGANYEYSQDVRRVQDAEPEPECWLRLLCSVLCPFSRPPSLFA